ncbi:ORF6N domain-containing protein [Selenomonas sp. F0473]|jgi:phage antirepressor protein|uniref:ORF6N domain-containing protein n=1 Tax=Selenomonas sp. F0473 TaxID=999423 RepID=UPI0025CD2372|nr:ORF6N domain-containing protein [Selenomonas sp. F0473]
MNELTVLEHNNIRVMTTEQLAEAYGCAPKQIQQNFSNNRVRFIAGKHFFVLEGQDLQTFRLQVENIELQISPKTRHLYLWTERGAARHSKMLGTERAWDVFEQLEDSYFKVAKNMTPEEFLLYSAQRMVEQAKTIKAANARIDKVDERLLEVESKQMTIDEHHYTIIGYANLTGVRGVGRDAAARLGRRASAISRKQGYHIGKEYDAKYGMVNTYHVDVLQEVFR